MNNLFRFFHLTPRFRLTVSSVPTKVRQLIHLAGNNPNYAITIAENLPKKNRNGFSGLNIITRYAPKAIPDLIVYAKMHPCVMTKMREAYSKMTGCHLEQTANITPEIVIDASWKEVVSLHQISIFLLLKGACLLHGFFHNKKNNLPMHHRFFREEKNRLQHHDQITTPRSALGA